MKAFHWEMRTELIFLWICQKIVKSFPRTRKIQNSKIRLHYALRMVLENTCVKYESIPLRNQDGVDFLVNLPTNSQVLSWNQENPKFKNPASLRSAYGPREHMCEILKHSIEKWGRSWFSCEFVKQYLSPFLEPGKSKIQKSGFTTLCVWS